MLDRRNTQAVLPEERTRFNCAKGGNGAQGRNRTSDTVIFSHVLYQLSYLGARIGRRAPAVRQAVF